MSVPSFDWSEASASTTMPRDAFAPHALLLAGAALLLALAAGPARGQGSAPASAPDSAEPTEGPAARSSACRRTARRGKATPSG